MSTATATTTTSNTTRQIPLVCPGHTRPLAELQFLSPPSESHRTFLVSACHDKMPMIRDAVSGDWIGTWAGHKGAVWSTKLDPQGYLAATASGDFTVKVWDAVTGKELFTYPHGHIVKTVDFSKDSTRLATGGHEGILRVFDLEKGGDATQTVMEFPLLQQGGAEGGQKVNITKCQWLDNDLVLAATSDGKIYAFHTRSDTQTQTQSDSQTHCVCTLQVEAEVRDMEVTELQKEDGNHHETTTILTVAAGETVSFFQLDINKTKNQTLPLLKGTLLRQHKMPMHFREEGGASLHPETGDRFVAGGSDLWVRVFDFDSGKELECHRGHHGPIRCVRYAPDGKTYATGSEDGTIRIWKTDPLSSE
mmetsp:Transcript_17417/g.33027  ORF Transcript_17417/g.33027 Transcript_17417/m.33027 type:complete len:363 (-) Transcript_17417:960-2048(-)|eukprot:CAMPEP_0176494874 /NCGR_PEP_ID=MMETSP0200_2-20121128/10346_1 /TAXON_ID=947934 /ORGANISM="Chaetoceros sp., Strain GSL56" /LENGTH=362 /DNA_ID=CAMNT_0017892695 /DNA_START=91 /DNA_END=1179 /DNA_ORIENTATION=-